MKRKTQSYTAPAPKTPPKRRGKKRGGTRRGSETPAVDASKGITWGESYTPDGSDPDDT